MEDKSRSSTNLEQLVLRTLEAQQVIPDSLEFAQSHGVDHAELVSELNSLASYGLVVLEVVLRETTELTEEGEEVVRLGSPEFRVWAVVGEAGITKEEAQKKLDAKTFKAGFGEAMSKKNQWIEMNKESGKLVRKAATITDAVQQKLVHFHKTGELDQAEKNVLCKNRKLIRDVKKKNFVVKKGPKFTLAGKPILLLDITSEILANGSWKGAAAKNYNLETLGIAPSSGHLHPLLKVRNAFREIFLEMGFEEMPTNNFVESSFWNFDALFQPQQHPARDAHDTFFLTEPASLISYPEDFLERVKEMHERGGAGSIGYRYDWKLEEAKKNILRTHTTAVSTRMLYKLAQEKPFVPKKYFSIDRVYRNETLDSTHLAEFHQIEGLIADYDLTLADLIGVISQFFQKWGMTELRFKPAYNPYTEPSMEIFAFHPGLNKWVEIGNSGMFRPEMLLPMGLDPKVRVIAWGLGLERPTMVRYGIKNIRDLVGHKVSLDFIQQNPLCDIQLEDLYDAKKFLKPKKE